jgi:N-acetylmuramoyl-L-alanine amidase
VRLGEQNTTIRGLARWAFAALVVFVLVACHGSGGVADSGAGEPPEVVRARALAGPTGADASATLPPLPPRAETLALAESVEARAVQEGAGARAVELHTLAATLLERAFRVYGKKQDAEEAASAYEAASKDLTIPGACDAALRGAALAGDAAHDATAAFVAFYKLSRRASVAPPRAGGPGDREACAGRIAASLAALEAFRPPASVLAAVDRGLEAQGAAVAGDAGATTYVDRVEHWPGKEAARVVVTLSRTAQYRVSDEAAAAGEPQRIFIDVDGAALGSRPRDVRGSGIVTRVRVMRAGGGARVVLDLDGGTVYRRAFDLREPFRNVVDVARRPPNLSAARGRTVSRIVLDPGHGGYDAGATGPTGLKEKDVTLDVAKRVRPILARAGLDVVLTRTDDRFVSLEERTARANQVGADLFVSIHCNAAENHARRGVETYVLDTTRDEIAQRVAARENATSAAATAELASILANMRLADQASHSTHLAELLQRASMASLRPSNTDVIDGGVHYAGFYVLVGARMPAVLFETSYISNPTEEQRLASPAYKDRLADAIANAIRAYREGR